MARLRFVYETLQPKRSGKGLGTWEYFFSCARLLFPLGREGAAVALEFKAGCYEILAASDEGGYISGRHGGRRRFKAFINACFALGAQEVYADTEAHATGIYRRWGFEPVGDHGWRIRRTI